MKVTQRDYDLIKSKIAEIPIEKIKDYKQWHDDLGYSEIKFCWGIFHISNAGLIPEIRKSNYNDSHLQTAIVKIIREMLSNHNKDNVK